MVERSSANEGPIGSREPVRRRQRLVCTRRRQLFPVTPLTAGAVLDGSCHRLVLREDAALAADMREQLEDNHFFAMKRCAST